MTDSEVVRAMFTAYQTGDRKTADRLLDPDLTFTSPQDDHIGKATYLERCFPTVGRLVSQQLLDVVEGGSQGVFVLYEYVLVEGGRYRNTECITVRDGRIVEVQVFFGGKVADD
jgi:ketosteroid isomerase-like protein